MEELTQKLNPKFTVTKQPTPEESGGTSIVNNISKGDNCPHTVQHEVGRPRSLDNEPSVPDLEPHQHTVPPHSCSARGDCAMHRRSLPGSKMTNYLRFLQELAIR
jgi:hypothetical protein